MLRWLSKLLTWRPVLTSHKECVEFALTNFYKMSLRDWQKIGADMMRTGLDADATHLFYALRIASAVPKIKSTNILQRRALDCRYGARFHGLDGAKDSKLKRRVEAFIGALFVARANQLITPRFEKLAASLKGAKTIEKRLQIGAELQLLVGELRGIDIGGTMEAAGQWSQQIDAILAALPPLERKSRKRTNE